MPVSYAELLQAPTKEQQLATLLQLMKLAGFESTSWHDGSVPRTIVEIEAETLSTQADLIAKIAAGGLLADAEDDWLTLLARHVYQEERLAAIRTRGRIVLTCSALAGPYTIQVGQLHVVTAGGLRFTNRDSGTLASEGTLTLEVEAETGGAAYNVPAGTLTTLLTPLAGVTVNNPVDVTTGTWITQTGADEEGDEELRERCRAKWATLAEAGGTRDWYVYTARSVTAEVRRVKVLGASDHGASAPGHVTVYLAGDSGGVSVEAVQAVDAVIQAKKPLLATVHVESAETVAVEVVATVYVKASARSAAEDALGGLFSALEQSLDVGDTVYTSAIIEVLMTPAGVINATLDTPSADVVLEFDQVAKFDISGGITWVEV